MCRGRPRPRADRTSDLSSRKESVIPSEVKGDPASPNPAKQKGAPSFRVLCGKVGNENPDERTALTFEIVRGLVGHKVGVYDDFTGAHYE
jgi:hypothetical protein